MVLGWYDFIFKESIPLPNGMFKNRYNHMSFICLMTL
jgi:hypothetical protein